MWARLASSVRPLRIAPLVIDPPTAPAPLVKAALAPKSALTPKAAPPALKTAARRPVPVLDDRWEKQIKRGQIIPDFAIDLHGHSLSAAHVRLEQALAAARAQGVRVLLVVTGKPRNAPETGASGRRGAIRAEIGHWLDSSTHADAIASIRTAHPRHGGSGALYLILRRKK